MVKYMAVAVAVAVAVSGGGAVAVAMAVAGLTKRFSNYIRKDFLINVWGYLTYGHRNLFWSKNYSSCTFRRGGFGVDVSARTFRRERFGANFSARTFRPIFLQFLRPPPPQAPAVAAATAAKIAKRKNTRTNKPTNEYDLGVYWRRSIDQWNKLSIE